ncbi:hypothetical protein [Candidatus Chloroploca asiatica]|uniref:Uncharacterized protein n=1 Tax=Candidatus Chloroploca asiatica TaxID=1506545 RepID=A0A2H3KN40_9CHLR|nr:hypothetical protein [Candidatus Chloroploca asiatica]PDV99581.1 hypothetical protein A9Q02_11575 [Candidatus Chloroploca asiatica]
MLLSLPVNQTISAIHATPPRLVYVCAGAGSLALAWLHAVAGSSRTILEARDVYAPQALVELVVDPSPQAVSATTALALANWALQRAKRLIEGDWPLLGVACTAAIATDRVRRGADRAFVAVASQGAPWLGALTLCAPGVSVVADRVTQEAAISELVIGAIAHACGLEAPPLSYGYPLEQLEIPLGCTYRESE